MIRALKFSEIVAKNIRTCCHYALYRICPYYLELSIYNSFSGKNAIAEKLYAIAQYGNPKANAYCIHVAPVFTASY